MARRNQAETYKKAMIDYKNMEIVEVDKDELIRTYDIHKILQRWDGIEGITKKSSRKPTTSAVGMKA